VDKKRRRQLLLNEFSVISSKRSRNSTATADHDGVGSGLARLRGNENRSAVLNGGHRERVMDDTQRRQLAFSPSTRDRDQASSPILQQLPVIPKPRFPTAIFSSSALPLVPSANMANVPFHNNSTLPFPPFCLAPSVEYRTAVPPSAPSLPLPPLSLFGLYHPAFWGALPYFISRVLRCEEQVPEDPLSECQSRSSVDGLLQSPSPGLCESLSRSWESRPVRRRICDPASLSRDIGLPSLQDAASSGLEDMAKMVSRLDGVTKVIV